MSRVANAEMGDLVYGKTPFTNNNGTCYGEWRGSLYAVFSYGEHWPLFIYDSRTKQWFENQGKYSSTTSRHRTHCARRLFRTVLMNKVDLMDIMYYGGYTQFVAKKLRRSKSTNTFEEARP